MPSQNVSFAEYKKNIITPIISSYRIQHFGECWVTPDIGTKGFHTPGVVKPFLNPMVDDKKMELIQNIES